MKHRCQLLKSRPPEADVTNLRNTLSKSIFQTMSLDEKSVKNQVVQLFSRKTTLANLKIKE